MERACTTHSKGQPCSQESPARSPLCLSKPSSLSSQRGFPAPAAQGLTRCLSRCWWHPGQVEHEELPRLLDQGYLNQSEHRGVFSSLAQCLLTGLPASPWEHTGAPTCTGGRGAGLREPEQEEAQGQDRALSPLWTLPCLPHAPCHITSGLRSRDA